MGPVGGGEAVGSGSAVIWSRGFRPFFLLAGADAVLSVAVWLARLWGSGPTPGWWTPPRWHAHEMIFGFAAAAVAGFLLTSVPVWTARPAIAGRRLAALVVLWLAGRVAVFFASALPSPWIAAILDVSFLAALASAIGGSIYRSRSRRNFAFPVLVAALAVANGLMHGGALGAAPELGAAGMRLGVGILVLLVATLGGRLVPLFTAAALKRSGATRHVERLPWADAAAGPVLGAFVFADTIAPGSAPSGALALAAAAIVALRMKGWGLRNALGDPLVGSMHVAYLWIPVGLAALGVSSFSDVVPRSIAVHALTVGCIGGMILAIMTRVALGHTGRPFVAPRGIPLAYALVFCAALTRTAGLLLVPSRTGSLLLVAGALWMTAFAIFLAVYAPVLVSPRIDGRPG